MQVQELSVSLKVKWHSVVSFVIFLHSSAIQDGKAQRGC